MESGSRDFTKEVKRDLQRIQWREFLRWTISEDLSEEATAKDTVMPAGLGTREGTPGGGRAQCLTWVSKAKELGWQLALAERGKQVRAGVRGQQQWLGLTPWSQQQWWEPGEDLGRPAAVLSPREPTSGLPQPPHPLRLRPGSLMRAGFFNETICPAFRTRLSLPRTSISPFSIPHTSSAWDHPAPGLPLLCPSGFGELAN